ncbi:hypothetical protein AGOR_G00244020 [Albula goreensis]|uniref:Rho guanine nucleotide exchange factor 18-like n=1 Tax=Albula goreensis TaxID=1534307 RepID=A0A8T3CJQ8_9TELE|nr:hypothetical protein AGOR_G00244020 [Albula goreensis]
MSRVASISALQPNTEGSDLPPARPVIAMETRDLVGAVDLSLDLEPIPILVRTMSTSRRHSWGALTPLPRPGRRLSLEADGVESDGEKGGGCLPQSAGSHSHQAFAFPECTGRSRAAPKQNMAAGAKPKLDMAGVDLCSRPELLAKFKAAQVSRVLEKSKRAAEAGTEEPDQGRNLQMAERRSHVLIVQTVLQELKQYHGANQRTAHCGERDWGNVTCPRERLEEGRVERGSKVRRTLSSLRDRVTGSLCKDKGKQRDQQKQRESDRGIKREKGSDREVKREKGSDREVKREKVGRSSSDGHLLVPGAFSSCTHCSLCRQTLLRRQSLQCLREYQLHSWLHRLPQLLDAPNIPLNSKGCTVSVHKSCENLLAECTRGRDQVRDSPLKTVQNTVLLYSQAQRDQQCPHGPSGAPLWPGMTIAPQGPSTQPAVPTNQHCNSGLLSGEMDEPNAMRLRRQPEDTGAPTPFSADGSIAEDVEYGSLSAELESDAHDFEAESWSSVVDPQYLQMYQKEAIKRQDVIYELVQTEVHHVRTLKLLLRVYARELRASLQMEEEKLERLFPQVENLLQIHLHFLQQLKQRRSESLQPGTQRNYAILRLGDVLTAQFSGRWGDRMRESYGEFCCHHSDAVSFYKEQLQTSKRFQGVIRRISNLAIVRRLGIPECLLLVTQRITKYPVLLERILHNTEAETAEQQEMEQALGLIKELIGQVDGQVCTFERAARLRDIASRVEPRSQGRMKDGLVFRREDLAPDRRTLLHHANLTWKAASGRLKDVLAVLCSDVLLLLQEKDQKYVFSTVDSKPSVISLQKLIVREVAHEEKAMFLICASSADPEMYEIHASSKDDCAAWMARIRQAVESCPHGEEELFSEQEEARLLKLRLLQEQLMVKDAKIAQSLTEKLQMFADLKEAGEQLLRGTISEVENLQNLLLSGVQGVSPQAVDRTEHVREVENGDQSQCVTSDLQVGDLSITENLKQQVKENPLTCNPVGIKSFPESEFFDRVLVLSQKLYTLQVVLAQQDSQLQLQRVALLEREVARGGRGRGVGGALLEQEKQRNLERQREEVASFQRLQSQQRQEQARWEREREREQAEAEARDAALRLREEECRRQEVQMCETRAELDAQRQRYQQDLEHLRETTRSVERERKRLEQQNYFRKTKTISNPGAINMSSTQLLANCTLLNGDFLAPKPHLRLPLPSFPCDTAERPPKVPPRRESMVRSAPKTELPIHLVSTTNQLHNPSPIQQQIPTKLALSKGKERRDRSKREHQRSHSGATLDLRQILPIRASGKEEGSVRGRSVSPLRLFNPDRPLPDTPPPPPPPRSHAPSFHRPSGPQLSQASDIAKDDIIFF